MTGVVRVLSSNRKKAAKKMMDSGVAGRNNIVMAGEWLLEGLSAYGSGQQRGSALVLAISPAEGCREEVVVGVVEAKRRRREGLGWGRISRAAEGGQR